MSYKYTQNWFLVSELSKTIYKFLDASKQLDLLEIGTFEGLSTTFFADNFLNHQSSTLDAVDPFLHINDNDHDKYLNNVENNFDYNISICNNKEKVSMYKLTSDKFFDTFKNNDKKYDFIYIDGCHSPDYIKRDMNNSFKKLKINGIMWMDDYLGGHNNDIKNTMNEWVKNNIDNIEIIHSGYQLGLRRTK